LSTRISLQAVNTRHTCRPALLVRVGPCWPGTDRHVDPFAQGQSADDLCSSVVSVNHNVVRYDRFLLVGRRCRRRSQSL